MSFLSRLFGLSCRCKKCYMEIYPYDPNKQGWIHWHQRKGESDYTGYVWCPYCNEPRYEGFDDRVFG